MILYDELIGRVHALAAGAYSVKLDSVSPWPTVDKEDLILKFDMAAELGGGSCHAVSGLAFTSNQELVPESGLYILGDEGTEGDSGLAGRCTVDGIWTEKVFVDGIPEEKASDYGRFVVIRLSEEMDKKSQQEAYAFFRKLDYLRYHLFLKGVCARISSVAHREVLRISKEAKASGISFSNMGKTWLEAYLAIDQVEAVEIYYFRKQGKMDSKQGKQNLEQGKIDPKQGKQDLVQGKKSLYQELDKLASACEDITESLNVIFKGVSMDCNSCGQKAVCDAVEGLREMHQELVQGE